MQTLEVTLKDRINFTIIQRNQVCDYHENILTALSKLTQFHQLRKEFPPSAQKKEAHFSCNNTQ